MAFHWNKVQSLDAAAKEVDWCNNLSPDIPKFTFDGDERHVAGILDFQDSPRKATAPFVRVKDDTNPDAVYKVLTEQWKLEKPKLLVSVTGGAKSFNVNHALLAKFFNGLLKIAKTPGAWFITGGTNTGVMKLIGQMMHGETNNCIGIASWGVMTDEAKDDLVKEKAKGSYTYAYKLNNSMTENKSAFLDHNHRQFILVDKENGGYGDEIKFRTKLETCIANGGNRTESDTCIANGGKVPSVLIVIEGGVNTIKTVHYSLTSKFPVVVIKDSGRASDCIGYILENVKEEEAKNFKKLLGKDMNENKHFQYVKNIFDSLSDEKLKEVFDYLLSFLQYRNLITMFEIENDTDVDEAIIQALLCSKEKSAGDQASKNILLSRLELTILWNRADLAQEHIFPDIDKFKDDDYKKALKKAIKHNRVDFISIFVQFGVSLHNILTLGYLEELYNYAAKSDLSPLSNKRLLKLIDDKIDPNKKITRETVKRIVDSLCTNLVLQKEMFIKGYKEFNSNTFLEEPYKELFVWAVLNNFGEMALYFWQFDRDGIMKALVAVSMLEEMLSHARSCGIKEDIMMNLAANVKLFREQAVLLLKECSNKDEQMTEHLIAAPTKQFYIENSEFSRHNCMKIAFASHNRKFFAHETVQNLITRQLYGTLVSLTLPEAIKAWICFPILGKTLKFKKKTEINEMVDIAADYDKQDRPGQRKRFTATAFVKDKSNSPRDGNADSSGEKQPLLKISGGNYGSYENILESEIANNRDVAVPELTETNETGEVTASTNAQNGSNGCGGTDNNDAAIERDETSNLQESTKPKENEDELPLIEKAKNFYLDTPCIVFFQYLVTYLIFLFLLSYVAMLDKRDTKPGYMELYLLLFVISLTLEEIREFLLTDSNDFKSKFKIYWSNNWNYMDCLAITLFYAAYASRYYESANEYSHLLYALDAGLWVLRTLNFFYLHPVLGVYVIMIHKMFKDMIYFLMILLIFLIAYGVSTNAILSPKGSVGEMIVGVLWQPYFNIYGELFIDRDPENNSTTRFGTPVMNHYGEDVAWIILGIYLLIANVLLLNLLIAIFNNTFTEIQENAAEHWKFYRYPLIVELMSKSPFGHPISLIYYAYLFVESIIKCSRKSDTEQQSEDKVKNLKLKQEILSQFEVDCMATLQKKQTSKAEKNEFTEELLERQKCNKSKLVTLEEKIDKIEQILTQSSTVSK